MFHQGGLPTPQEFLRNLMQKQHDDMLAALILEQHEKIAALAVMQSQSKAYLLQRLSETWTASSLHAFLEESLKGQFEEFAAQKAELEDAFEYAKKGLENEFTSPLLRKLRLERFRSQYEIHLNTLAQFHQQQNQVQQLPLQHSPGAETEKQLLPSTLATTSPGPAISSVRNNEIEEKVCVLKKTVEIVKPENHKEDEIEHITIKAFRRRKTDQVKVWVIKYTGKIVDPEDYKNRENEIEQVTQSVARSRRAPKKNVNVWVLKGTADIVDPCNYQPHEVEQCSSDARRSRKRKIESAMKAAGISIDPGIKENEIKQAKKAAAMKRDLKALKAKEWVLKGTGMIIDPRYQPAGTEIEQITKAEIAQRNTLEKMQGTITIDEAVQRAALVRAIPSVPQQGNSSATAKTTTNVSAAVELCNSKAARKRENNPKVGVPKDTATIVDADDYKEKESEIEQITKSAVKSRDKRAKSHKKRSRKYSTASEDSSNSTKRQRKMPNASAFFAVKMEGDTELPHRALLPIDEGEVLQVIKILRGENDANMNCTWLADALIQYLLTGIIPTQAVVAGDPSLDHFAVYLSTQKLLLPFIKQEGEPAKRRQRRVNTITGSTIDRNTLFGRHAAASTTYSMHEGVMGQWTEIPVIDLDHSQQTQSHFSDIDETLKKAASNHPNHVSFGTVALGRCGEFIDDPGHLLVYFATPDKVTYMDAQAWNGKTKTGNPIFHKIQDGGYDFLSDSQQEITKDTFGSFVFFAPMTTALHAKMQPKLDVQADEEPHLHHHPQIRQ